MSKKKIDHSSEKATSDSKIKSKPSLSDLSGKSHAAAIQYLDAHDHLAVELFIKAGILTKSGKQLTKYYRQFVK